MPHVLFVCTENRFRSPLAAACFEKELMLHGLGRDWIVSSAGTWTTNGLPATADSVEGAKQFGLDIRAHRSRVVDSKIMQSADMIIVMERGHKEALNIEFPELAPRVHLLSELAGGMPYDVPDPASRPAARDVCMEIRDLIHTAYERIFALLVTK